MTWTKLSDDFGDELAGLSDSAFRTHVEGLLWVMRRETDGHISERDIRRFAETADPAVAVQELLDHGLWDRTSTGYRIRHHMEHQPEPEVIAARRANDAKRQAKKRRTAAGLPEPESQPESQPESRRDSPRDHPRDSGRVGSGRVTPDQPSKKGRTKDPRAREDEHEPQQAAAPEPSATPPVPAPLTEPNNQQRQEEVEQPPTDAPADDPWPLSSDRCGDCNAWIGTSVEPGQHRCEPKAPAAPFLGVQWGKTDAEREASRERALDRKKDENDKKRAVSRAAAGIRP